MFLLKRKGNYRLQLTRTLKVPGRHVVELYVFTPHESSLSNWTLAEPQFYFGALNHSFGLLGLPSKERAVRDDASFTLLSPHYEIMYGSWFFQYQASMGRLRQQLQEADTLDETLARALRLAQNFALRLRKSAPTQSNQLRYFRQMDIYFSWHAEQFLLESMTLKGFEQTDAQLKASIAEFLEDERKHRKTQKYLDDFKGTPTRIWNRMNLYHRLLEYPVMLRAKVKELGSGTQRLVKGISTMLVMSLFTYVLFNTREGVQQLSLALLFGIAFVYAVRDLLRDDMIRAATRWLRKGKPRWKISLFMPYTQALLAQQRVWLDYRKLATLHPQVRERSGKWATHEERQIICYRAVLDLEKSALKTDELRERITLDCEPLCGLIQASHAKLFVHENEGAEQGSIHAHPIEKQHDYNLLLVYREPGSNSSKAQRWRLRLGSNGVVQCESKNAHWPDAPLPSASFWQRFRRRSRT